MCVVADDGALGRGYCVCQDPFSGDDCATGVCDRGQEPVFSAAKGVLTCQVRTPHQERLASTPAMQTTPSEHDHHGSFATHSPACRGSTKSARTLRPVASAPPAAPPPQQVGSRGNTRQCCEYPVRRHAPVPTGDRCLCHSGLYFDGDSQACQICPQPKTTYVAGAISAGM
jgi:hypothetical protein